MQVTLTPMTAGQSSIPLTEVVTFIGRHKATDLKPGGEKVSRKHAVIVNFPKKVIARDLGSSNGIYVNGKRVTETTLTNGNKVRFGNVEYLVHICSDSGIIPLKPEE